MTLLNIGASHEAIREARETILAVLVATSGRGECVALAALETLRVIGNTHATIRDCTFNGPMEPPKAVAPTKRDDWPLEYPYDQPQASVDQGRSAIGPAVEVREMEAPTAAPAAGSAAEEIAPWYAGSAADRAMDAEAAATPPVG